MSNELILQLGTVMLSHQKTEDRGAEMLKTLADSLSPQNATISGEKAPAPKAPAPKAPAPKAPAPKAPAPKAPAPKAPAPAPKAALTMTAAAAGVTYETYMATDGWTDDLLVEQGLATRTAPAPAPAPAPKPATPATPVGAMTPEELNAELQVEFRRLGSRDPIDKAMAEMGTASVVDLTPEQSIELITKVRAIVK